jgi:hypothetical protein
MAAQAVQALHRLSLVHRLFTRAVVAVALVLRHRVLVAQAAVVGVERAVIITVQAQIIVRMPFQIQAVVAAVLHMWERDVMEAVALSSFRIRPAHRM